MFRSSRTIDRRLPFVLSVVLTTVVASVVGGSPASAAVPFEIQSLDGSGNNIANPNWGRGGLPYARVGAARYADGRSAPVPGPNARTISNRVFNDVHQNIFSERGVTQWGFTWGQFLDHTFGLRFGGAQGEPQGETANIPFNANDPLETFRDDFGVIPFNRSAPAPGTGVTNPRQQVNSVSSYIDAFPVYGGTSGRLEWLRQGPVDGDMTNNSALLMLPGGYLPRRDARGDAATAPNMDVDGRLTGQPGRAAVAGDVRANESLALEATQTLFAREHNRIVNLLPASLSQEDRFQIARKVVIAEEQYVTYTEFLPAMGVNLPLYSGYQPGVDATLTNEFATVGYRAHSQIHGEVEVATEASRYSQQTLDRLAAQGVEIAVDGDEIELAVPLGVGFFNPDLTEQLQLGPLLEAIGDESEYNNDEQIDNQLRSVLFQVPVSGNPECLDGPTLPECFNGVVDLGAIDIERGRDHGMPTYNQLRQAYGLAPRTSFTAITGESTDQFPSGSGIDDPASLNFTQLRDIFGVSFGLTEERDPVQAVRGATRAAKLRAIYGSVDNVDAFVGMLVEPHPRGSDLGELQRAIWTREFTRLRDGDRFFYQNDPALTYIRDTYGIDFRRDLGDIIAANTDIPRADLAGNVFFVDGNVPPASCRVRYKVTTSWQGGFQTQLTITNTGDTPIPAGWTLRFVFQNGQRITDDWNGVTEQDEGRVPMVNEAWNAAIPAGGSVSGIGFNATWDNVTNTPPTRFTLNTTQCATG